MNGIYNTLDEKQEGKGIIFDIQRFSIHDGPGIRTTVFFKGCPLRCLWCQNPEGLVKEQEMAFTLRKCTGCRYCIEVCPEDAITEQDGGRSIDPSLCTLCGECVKVCPSTALEISGRWMGVSEVMEEIEKDISFYKTSGGGVTLSGGEPTFQPQFCIALLKNCQLMGIHTALDTCGYQKWDVLDEVLNHVDLVLYDIKHIDDTKHKQFTEVSNKLILDNIRRINSKEIPVIVRIPIIPGFTDSEDNIEAIVRFVANLKSIIQIDLLPYHGLEESKYKKLGLVYQLDGIPSPDAEHMRRLVNIVGNVDLKAKVGG